MANPPPPAHFHCNFRDTLRCTNINIPACLTALTLKTQNDIILVNCLDMTLASPNWFATSQSRTVVFQVQ